MLDDTANFSADHAATTDPQQSYRKRFEDLRLRRPTWIWAAASRLETADYRRFCDAVERLPDESFLRPWVELSGLIPKAKELARLELAGAMRDLRPFVQDEQAWAELEELRSHLESAYC
jgi:geranylgeranyl pyrophosphate synthase